MKAKTIKSILRKKVNDWLASIEDEAVRALAAKNTIITGGAIASMLLGEKVSDFDIYLRTHEAALALAKYYVDKFMGTIGDAYGLSVVDDGGRIKIATGSGHRGHTAGAQTLQDPGDIEDTYEETEAAALETDDKPAYRPVFLSTNAITLSSRVQIILRFYGEPEVIHENYDFVHCTNYWTAWDNELVLKQPALESLLAKELRYVGSKYPICSLIRVRKFVRRHWTINAGQILKMAWQISELDLTDVKVLEDQLTGVDVAFFADVIDKLKEKDPLKVNAAYLIEIIDRMF